MELTTSSKDLFRCSRSVIFKHFLWEIHPKTDDNFECTNEKHVGDGGKPKATHPGDVVFLYRDPYLGKTVYLHTDLKSYAAESITSTRLRGAFKSLCMTVDCARGSDSWRAKYSIDESEAHEVRGLLFVHNHDNGYDKPFYEAIDKVDLQALPVAPGTQLHYLGPMDIQRLYSVANDIIRLKGEGELPQTYTFYYPDLVISRRQGDVWSQPATVETLTSPYIIIKHVATDEQSAGYVIYYNAPASNSVDSSKLVGMKVVGAVLADDLLARMEFVSKEGMMVENMEVLKGLKYKVELAVFEVVLSGLRGQIAFAANGAVKISGQIAPKLISLVEKDLPLLI